MPSALLSELIRPVPTSLSWRIMGAGVAWLRPQVHLLKLEVRSLLMFLVLFKTVVLAMLIELVVVFQIGRVTFFWNTMGSCSPSSK